MSVCAAPDCGRELADHKWARIRSGWFEQKDGTLWCPDHLPTWVPAWRASREGSAPSSSPAATSSPPD